MYKKGNNLVLLFILIGSYFNTSCEDYVDIGAPDHIMVAETVFADGETASAAVQGIYNEMATADFSRGYLYSVTAIAGMSPDIFETTSATDTRYGPFQQNEISPIGSDDATANYNLWSSAYNIIYMANSVLEGTERSKTISREIKDRVGGQALFIRAFTYFYLVNLYGDLPLLLTTDYRKNAIAEREDVDTVYDRIAEDLDSALILLEGVGDYRDSERTNVNRFAAMALRARVYLYRQDWEKAEELAGEVIAQTSLYGILDDLDQVFLKNSREAIWQISPVGRGLTATYTGEGYLYRGQNSSQIKLSGDFVASMPPNDKRLLHWIAYNTGREFYFPQKYKDANSRNAVVEYSTVLRLPEQYLIRAEARAMQGRLSEAIKDIDVIRSRAGLGLLADMDPDMDGEGLLEEIMDQRKKELFAEWGHRWLDLKRTGRANEVLGPIKPLWQDTDVLFPVPGEEREKNPKLSQNNGY